MNPKEFLQWEASSRDTLDVKRCYIDIAGDLVSGVLLSQIIYWNLPSKKKESKLTIEREGKMWLAKERADWWGECRISPKQFDRAIEVLESKEFVVRKVFKFAGNATVHIWLNLKAIMAAVTAPAEDGRGENENSPFGNSQIDETEIPESTQREFPISPYHNGRARVPEITAKIPSESNKEKNHDAGEPARGLLEKEEWKAPETDHHKTIRLWMDQFQQQYAQEFVFTDREGKAVKRLLKAKMKPQDILEFAREVRRLPDKFRAAQGATLSGLMDNINTLRALVAVANADPK